jgi:hypothetical protein
MGKTVVGITDIACMSDWSWFLSGLFAGDEDSRQGM